MGITRGSARLLLEEMKRKPFEGSVLELGKMFIFFSDRELSQWAKKHDIELDEDIEAELSHDPVLAAHRCIDDRTFFRRLGFSRVQSLDAAPWEGADLIHDMNQPVPSRLHESFDMVFEGGTLQNIFDVVESLRNIHRMLKVGGRVIHAMTASHNQVDLGFFMFSPTFFHDFYKANGWALEKLLLCEHTTYWTAGKLNVGPFRVFEYEPGCLDHLSFGRYGNRQLTIFAVATKTSEATCDVIPQQTYYQRVWSEDRDQRMERQRQLAREFAERHTLYSSWPFKTYKYLAELIRRSGYFRKMPEQIARY